MPWWLEVSGAGASIFAGAAALTAAMRERRLRRETRELREAAAHGRRLQELARQRELDAH